MLLGVRDVAMPRKLALDPSIRAYQADVTDVKPRSQSFGA